MTRRQKWMLMGAAAGLVAAYLVVAFIAWDLAWPAEMGGTHPGPRIFTLMFVTPFVAYGAYLGGEMLDKRRRMEREQEWSLDMRRNGEERADYMARLDAAYESMVYLRRTNDSADKPT